MSLLDRCKALFERVRKAPRKLPSLIDIPADHVDKPEKLGAPLKKDQDYFQVRVNELYLTTARQWFTQFDPMVFVTSEFTYLGKSEMAIPFVVAPSMIKGTEVPTGMVFSDTRVAGIHPYRGSRLSLTVILYQVKMVDWARKLLKVVGNTAKTLDFANALGAYTKVAEAVLDGVEELINLDDTVPLLGQRREIDPDAGDELKPGYFTMIDADGVTLDPKTLWVKDNKLYSGPNLDDAQPFRAADYLLYSVTSRPKREDEANLPFYPLWEQVKKEAGVPTQEGWTSAKSNMLTLYQTMMNSPDLTERQAFELTKDYKERMKKIWDEAVDLGRMSEATQDKMAEVRAHSMEILNM